jgi:hypothetical protein
MTGLPTMPAFDLPELGWIGKHGQDKGEFELALIESIDKWKARLWHKPAGGLWTAPTIRDDAGVLTGTHWTRWCYENEYFPQGMPRVVTLIEPDPTARVYVIDTLADLLALEEAYPWRESPVLEIWPAARCRRPWPVIDWDALALDVAAVHLTEAGEWATRFSMPGLYGWDCETILWLQPRLRRGDLIELPARVEVDAE